MMQTAPTKASLWPAAALLADYERSRGVTIRRSDDAPLVDELVGVARRVEIVDGAGHFLQVERPDVVNRLVLDFLQEDPAA